MTLDELITKIDGEPEKKETQSQEAPKVETPVEDKEKDMLPIGQQFEEYCESKKRK